MRNGIPIPFEKVLALLLIRKLFTPGTCFLTLHAALVVIIVVIVHLHGHSIVSLGFLVGRSFCRSVVLLSPVIGRGLAALLAALLARGLWVGTAVAAVAKLAVLAHTGAARHATDGMVLAPLISWCIFLLHISSHLGDVVAALALVRHELVRIPLAVVREHIQAVDRVGLGVVVEGVLGDGLLCRLVVRLVDTLHRVLRLVGLLSL